MYLICGLALFLAVGILIPAFAEVPSPLQQLRDDTPMDQIQCKDGKILLQKNNRPACVGPDASIILMQRGYSLVMPVSEASVQPANGQKDGIPQRSQNIIQYNQMKLEQIELEKQQHKAEQDDLQHSRTLEEPYFTAEMFLDKIPSVNETVGFKIIETPTKRFFDESDEIKSSFKKSSYYDDGVKGELVFEIPKSFVVEIDNLPDNTEYHWEEKSASDHYVATYPIDLLSVIEGFDVPDAVQIITGTVTPTEEGNFEFGFGTYAFGSDVMFFHVDVADSYILTWPFQLTSSFEESTIKSEPLRLWPKGLRYDDLIESGKYSSYDEIDRAIAEGKQDRGGYYTASEFDWTGHDKDDWYTITDYLPVAFEASHATSIPKKIAVGERAVISVDLKSPNNIDEYVVYNVFVGPGIEFNTEPYNIGTAMITTSPPDVIRNIFSNGTRSFTYEIIGAEPGEWMFKDRINNGEFYRDIIIVE